MAEDRKSREQELRVAEDVHEEYPDYYDQDTLLSTESIKARPGYVQRWIRTSMRGTEDQSNVFKKLNKGWRPRGLDSVPKGQFVPHIDFNGSQVIGIHGMILMERPKALNDRQRQAVDDATRMQMQSVKQNLYREHDPKSGFTRPEMTEQTSTTRGRMPSVDD